MEFFRRALPVIIAAFFAFSCASEETEPYEDKELRSFERWMELNVPDAIKHDNGMYYQWLNRAPADAPAPQWGDYVRLNYRGLLLSNYDPQTQKASIFMTRSEDDAERLGTKLAYTHYVPQLLPYSRNTAIMPGMLAALQMMKAGTETTSGDSIRLFMPSWLSSTNSALTATYGYNGNASQPSAPVIVEMGLAGIEEHPQTKEEKFVNEYARREYNQSLGDTIREYIYFKFTTAPEAKADSVKADSTAKIFYAAYLAYDGFLLETNKEDIAKKWNRTVSTSTTDKSVTYKPSSPPESPTYVSLQALSEVFLSEKIKYGCKFEFITTSGYAFGASGKSPADKVTEVLPYQPIRFEVEVVSNK